MERYTLHIVRNGLQRIYGEYKNRNALDAILARLKQECPALDYYVEVTAYNI